MKKSFPGVSSARRRGFTATRTAALAATAALAMVVPVTGSASAAVPASATASQPVATHFVFTADSADTVGDAAYIDNPATNGKSGVILFVTPNYDPDGDCGCVFDSYPIAVGYDPDAAEWAVYNVNGDDMSLNESFSVLVVMRPPGHSVVGVESDPQTTEGDYTFITNSIADGHPNAKIQVTQELAPDHVIDPHPVGVWYVRSAKLWAIFNVDKAAMPLYAYFNVEINGKGSSGGKSSVLKTTTSNRVADTTFINSGLTNGNPGNVTFATPNWNPGGKGGTYNDVPTGVWYSSSNSQEGVFDENGSSPPLHSAYNLLVFPS
jgi:hypothetical protein